MYVLAWPFIQETVHILWEIEPTCASLDQFFKKSHKSVWVSKLYPLHWTLKYRLITKQKCFNDDIFRDNVMIGIIIVLQFVRRELSSVRQKISATYPVSAVTESPTVRMKRTRLTAVSEKLILCQHMPQKLHCLAWIWWYWTSIYVFLRLAACTENEFSCQNGRCIPQSSACDKKVDCLDKSDEGTVCGKLLS